MPNKFAAAAYRFQGCLWLLMMVILLPYIATAAEPDNYQILVQELLANAKYQEAIQLLGETAANTDDDVARQQVLLQQGDVYYYYLENYDQALISYRIAYYAAPKNKAAADALYRRGLIYMDKLHEKDKAVKEFEVVLQDFPDYHKRDELKRLLKGTLSRAYKVDLINRKNYWKFFICLIDALIIFFWKVVHEYASVKKSRKIMVDITLTILIILNATIWWIVIHAEAQLDMLGLGIIK